MRSKLTLSLPEKTILEAKRIAKVRRTTVSALFEASLDQWRTALGGKRQSNALNENAMVDLIGAFRPQDAFDTRSAHIRRKHG